ncbi:MAG: sulfite exporter TauE/SafE family protein [Gammaproteobacteria bacterium]|nr:sulfite exporter TauE/SafE family protein [Gammaproteobacteria bacterium]
MFFGPAELVFISLAFVLAGLVKGVVGLGLPTTSLALLAIAFDLPTAMALLLVPSLVTNCWQALNGGYLVTLLRRLWPMLTAATLCIGIGGLALQRIELYWLTALLGLLLVIYAASGLAGLDLRLAPRREAWSGPLVGALNGVLTGMTGSFVVPGVMYLRALGLPRDQLVQAMGLLFALSTLALGLVLRSADLLPVHGLGWSGLALLPTLLGMALGQQLRRRLSESRFRRLLMLTLLGLGGFILVRALWPAVAG